MGTYERIGRQFFGSWRAKGMRRVLPYLVSLQLLLGPGAQLGLGAGVSVTDSVASGSENPLIESVMMKNFITFRGRNREGQPYAIDGNGVVCTYRKANARELELDLTLTTGEKLGSVEYHRVNSAFGGGMGKQGNLSGISVTWRTASGTAFSIGNTGEKDRRDLELDFTTLEFGGARTVKGEIDRSSGGDPQLSGNLSDISARLKGDAKLLALLKASGIFLTGEGMSTVFGKPVAMFDPGLSCLRAGAQCLCMAAIYIATLTGLVMACGSTVGVGCYVAIAIHPGVCCEVAEVCSAAVDACESPCFN